MHVSLTTELESRIKANVKSGLYNNAREVIREALYRRGVRQAPNNSRRSNYLAFLIRSSCPSIKGTLINTRVA